MNADDRWAIQDLVHRYAADVDARDTAAVTSLFTEDGVLVLPDPPEVLEPVHEHVGHEAIAAALGSLTGIVRTFHAIVGLVLGPRDSARIACVAHHVLPGGATDLVWHVRYDDSYRSTPDGWRIARRALTIDLIETRPLKRVRS